MNSLIERCRKAGIRLWAEGDALRYGAPKGAMTPELLADLKIHKRTLLEELAHPDPPIPRGLAGYAVPPGVPPLGDCALAKEIRSLPKDDPAPGTGASMARLSPPVTPETTEGVLPGISREFAARLDAQDLADIAAGDIPLEAVQAFEQGGHRQGEPGPPRALFGEERHLAGRRWHVEGRG